MPRREDFLILKSYIEQKGGSEVILEVNRRGHPRIYFSYRGVRKLFIIADTSSDFRATDNAKSQLNQLFSYIEDVTPHYVEPQKETEARAPSLELPQQTFGERLQYAREQQQLSRERLSDLSEVDEELIQRFEITKQETLKDFTTALLLSSALNLSLSYLVGEQTAEEFKPMAEVGDAISRRRQEKSLSLIEVARKAGLSVQQLANIETGLFNPALSKIDDIAKALQVRREDLTKEVPVETVVKAPAQPSPSKLDQVLYDDVNTLEDFAHFIKFLRERKGLSQMQIADALGMHYPSEVSKTERGLWSGSVFQRHAPLAKVLGVPADDMKTIINRVVENAGPAPSIIKSKQQKAASVQWPKPAAPEERPVTPVVQMYPLEPERFLDAIREQGELTRALMRSQHQGLVDILKTLPTDNNPAEMLHRIIDNLFRKD